MSDFPNGIRDDFIDTNKVLRIYSSKHADGNISRNLVADVIHANGIENGGRFYFVKEQDREIISLVLAELLARYSVVCYAVAYEKHAEFFNRLHIFSPNVLKKIWQENCTDYFYFDEFCSASKMTRLDREVSKVFMATGNSLSLEDLQAKLPYVSPNKILEVLSYAKRYLLTNTGRYFPVSKIDFDSEEILTAERQIFSRIDANGYAVPEDYDLSSNFALNPELTEKDLLNVIYEKFFRKSAVVEEKTSLLREFISEQDELPDDKLFAFAETLQIGSSAALRVANEKMTRVAKDLFVRDSPISFDIAGVDVALTPFVQKKNNFVALRHEFYGFSAGCRLLVEFVPARKFFAQIQRKIFLRRAGRQQCKCRRDLPQVDEVQRLFRGSSFGAGAGNFMPTIISRHYVQIRIRLRNGRAVADGHRRNEYFGLRQPPALRKSK